VAAVEEAVDRFFGDRPVRVALPPEVVAELSEDPFLTLNLYPPARREATRSAMRAGSVISDIAPTAPRCLFDDVFDVERATPQSFDVEAQVVGLGRVAGGVPNTAETTGIGVLLAIMATASAPRASASRRLARRELDPGTRRVPRQT